MTETLGRILLNQFVSTEIVKFSSLSEQERVGQRGIKGMSIDFRVVLKAKATEQTLTALQGSFPLGTKFGSIVIESLAVGSKYS